MCPFSPALDNVILSFSDTVAFVIVAHIFLTLWRHLWMTPYLKKCQQTSAHRHSVPFDLIDG
jgi:hypothetical protein